jgi:hypothetical protein
MAAATIFLWFGRSQVGPAYKTALTISGLVTAIAASLRAPEKALDKEYLFVDVICDHTSPQYFNGVVDGRG